MRNLILIVGFCLSCLCALPCSAITSGNLLVANGGVVYEYTPTGGFVGAVTGDLRNGINSESRGIAFDRFGRVHVLIRPHDGNDDMFLATFDPTANTTQFNEISFHNHNGDTTYGDIGADGNYVYAPDQIFARQGQGVIRYPLNNLGSPERILETLEPTDVTVGYDGLLYVQTSNGGDIDIYNPSTLVRVGGFTTVNDMRDVAVTAAGDIFTLHSDRIIRRYLSNGTLVDSLQLGNEANHSMALAEDGTIVVGSAGTALFFTDTSLDSFTTVLTPASQEENWGNFVTFATRGILAGDLNMDGFVGLADLNIVLGAWNQNVPPGDPLADPSDDGFVGIEDLNTVLGNWNAGTPPLEYATIPEPTAVVIVLMGLGLFGRRAA